jgi:hypothetical protein
VGTYLFRYNNGQTTVTRIGKTTRPEHYFLPGRRPKPGRSIQDINKHKQIKKK